MSAVPQFWKTSLEDVRACVEDVKKGTVKMLCRSPGGREVYLVSYGKDNDLHRTANRSSALGAADESCYANRSSAGYRPTLLIVGCIHGGEFEGTAAILNLISLLETGRDLAGAQQPELSALAEQVNWRLIPIATPDGRSHVPFDSLVGMTFEQLRYYNQGTWLDGSLCGWPDCKKIHPVKGHVQYLGGYFNDNGVNLMHDDFFGNMAAETNALLRVTEECAPDFAVLLHGGADTVSCMLRPAYAPSSIKREVGAVEERMLDCCEKAGLPYRREPDDCGEEGTPPASFNLISAMYQLCGAPCVTYESNQGLGFGEVRLTHEQIYRQHMLLFACLCRHVLQKYKMLGGDAD